MRRILRMPEHWAELKAQAEAQSDEEDSEDA